MAGEVSTPSPAPFPLHCCSYITVASRPHTHVVWRSLWYLLAVRNNIHVLGLWFSFWKPGPQKQRMEIFGLEAIPAGPPHGALIVQVSTQPGPHLVAHEQALLGGRCLVVAGQKGYFKMLFGVEVVLQLRCHSSIHPQRGLFSGNFLLGKLKITENFLFLL